MHLILIAFYHWFYLGRYAVVVDLVAGISNHWPLLNAAALGWLVGWPVAWVVSKCLRGQAIDTDQGRAMFQAISKT